MSPGRAYGAGGGKGKRPAGASGKRVRFSSTLNVVFEDEQVLVVDKPAGILTATMPDHRKGETRDETLFGLVKEHVRTGKGGQRGKPRRVWIVHRLDKEVSGLLVFAKTEAAFSYLKEELRQKRVHRLYAAVVEGATIAEKGTGPGGRTIDKWPSGTVQSFLIEDESGIVRSTEMGEASRMKRAGDDDDEGPKLAVTHWRAMASGHGRTLVQVRLETGRKNQIRVHLAEMGRPIVGDRRYGAATDPLGRVVLHAMELGFTHPTTGQMQRHVSPIPGPFKMLLGGAVAEGIELGEERGAEQESEGVTEAKSVPREREVKVDRPLADARGSSADASAKVSSEVVETSWDEVAGWYDALIEEQKSDHFKDVIVPGTLKLLRPKAGMRVLDVACGQGLLVRRLGELGVTAWGVDASPRLIEAARKRGGEAKMFAVGDAREIGVAGRSLGIEAGTLDAATCVMALMNIEPLEPVLKGVAGGLKVGGAFVAVMLHPAFRSPVQTSWGWDESEAEKPRQYRRVDGYLSPGQAPITMNPGRAAHGAEAVTTWTFHRPVQTYVRACAAAGLLIESLEEWPSVRMSQPGPTARGKARATEENRARREIPMFLAIRAVKVGVKPEAE
jgi:23S rRNA-/tRNA-specific pseudouridylate synthase/SAM-dependent methyltransferase